MHLCTVVSSVHKHEVQPHEHEGNAEPLAHVERHALLEVYLVFFEELDEEAEGEDFYQAQPEVEAAAVGPGGGQGGHLLLFHADGLCLPLLAGTAV